MGTLIIGQGHASATTVPSPASAAAAGLVLALALAGPTAAESVRYVAGTGSAAIVCAMPQPHRTCLGGATFAVPVDASEAAIDVRDLATDETPATYRWSTPDGEGAGEGSFCTATTAPVPAGDVGHLDVFVEAVPAGGPCDDATVGATAGSVDVQWG